MSSPQVMSLSSEQLLCNYQQVQTRIQRAQTDSNEQNVLLLAVSKTKPAQMVETLYQVGQRDFGENYLQDAVEKIQALKNLNDIRWHFIGQIQSNKTATIAQHFHWAHSIDRLKIARRLSEQRPSTSTALNICLQVNLDGEDQKGGIQPEELLPLALEISQLPQLKLRGLMCIPKARSCPQEQQACFAQLAKLMSDLNTHGLQCDTLSMGMSGDLEAAIAAGSTMVRIGGDIFWSARLAR